MAAIKSKRKGMLAAIFAALTIGSLAAIAQPSDKTLQLVGEMTLLPAELAAIVATGKYLEYRKSGGRPT